MCFVNVCLCEFTYIKILHVKCLKFKFLIKKNIKNKKSDNKNPLTCSIRESTIYIFLESVTNLFTDEDPFSKSDIFSVAVSHGNVMSEPIFSV